MLRARIYWMPLFAACLLSVALPRDGAAQGKIVIGRPPGGGGDVTSLFPQDRTVMRKLKTAGQLIEQEKYNEAVRLLASVLSGEDFLYKAPEGESTFVSIKAEARRMIGALPAAGRDAYELQYGTEARARLDEAVANADPAMLAQVAALYFHTEAGYEATWLLGEDHLQHGRALAAALCYHRLREAPPSTRKRLEPALSFKESACWLRVGMPQPATEVLTALRHDAPQASVVVGGERTRLFEGGDVLAALRGLTGGAGPLPPREAEQWLMPRGNPARSLASADGGPLLNFRFQSLHYTGYYDPTGEATDAGVVELLKEAGRELQSAGVTMLPAAQPLLVGDRLLVRTATELVALDRQGRRVWRAASDDALQQVLRQFNEAQHPRAGTDVQPNAQRNVQALRQQLKQGLLRRAWMDATYGTLSSDGQRVYCVEDLGFATNAYYLNVRGRKMLVPNPFQFGVSKPNNTLGAYDLATGKAVWELAEVKLADTQSPLQPYFLGPPLPLAGRLYVLAEIQSEVRLLVLDPADVDPSSHAPRVLWTQRLCAVELPVQQDPLRQTAGASPSYANGVLVCPTAAGAVVAVDLGTRSLLWGYTYSRDAYQNNPQVWGRPVPVPTLQLQRGWADSHVALVGGRVVLSPPGSSTLQCLQLLDGKPAWGAPLRDGNGLFAAATAGGRLVVVGGKSVQAVSLDEGQPIWTTPLPAGTRPAGHGFHDASAYHLPLSNGELARLNLEDGALTTRSLRAPELDGVVAVRGNLISAGGRLVQQGVLGVDCFRQVSREELEQRLSADPEDEEALASLGEILLQQGQRDEAIAHLRRALAVGDSARPRRLLTTALLEGLEADFAAYRDAAAELETLAETPAMRARYLRVLADGLRRSGEYLAALDGYLRLAEIDLENAALQRVEPERWIRHDRWVAAQLASMTAEAPEARRAEIASRIEQLLAEAAADEDPGALRRLLHYFGGHRAADRLRHRLAELLLRRKDQERPVLELEMLLTTLASSDDDALKREAVARLADNFGRNGPWTSAAYYYGLLTERWGDVPCLDGKTGNELFAELPSYDPVVRSKQPRQWPKGKVDVDSTAVGRQSATNRNRIMRVPTTAAGGPFFRGITFQIEGSHALVARKAWRGERGRTGFADEATGAMRPVVRAGHRLEALGHLAVLSTGYDLLGIDMAKQDGAGQLLWRQSLTESMPGVPNEALLPHPHCRVTSWGGQRVEFYSAPYSVQRQQGQPLGSLAPAVGAGHVAFVRGNELIAVDPLSGDELWKRRDISLGSDVLGDDELLVTVGHGETDGRAFRAIDGAEVGRREVPPAENRMAVLGGRVLCWETAQEQVTLRLFDVLEGGTLWSSTFAAGAKATLLGAGEVAVCEPGGRFEVLEVATGVTRFGPTTLKAVQSLASIHVFRSSDRYVLVLNQQAARDQALNDLLQNAVPMPGAYDFPLVEGTVHGFDRETGRLLWSKPVRGLGLPPGQPQESPVLAFVTPLNRIQGGFAQRRTQTSVAFLDRRNGRVIHKETFYGLLTNFQVFANSARKNVEFSSPLREINLTFTDAEWPPDASEPELTVKAPAAAGNPWPGPQPQPLPQPLPIQIQPLRPR